MNDAPGILLQFAMEKEASPFLRLAGAPSLETLRPGFPYRFVEIKNLFSQPVAVTVGGKDPRFNIDPIGTVPAALQALIGIDRFSPRLLVNAGTAGGYLKHGAQLGEVFVGSGTASYHDRRVALPVFEEYCRGRYPITDLGTFAIHSFRKAAVSTGDSLDCPPEDQSRIDENGAALKDMEAGAIAGVCERLGVPFVPVKAVTDFVDHHEETSEQFLKNLELATGNLAAALMQIFRALR